MYIEDVVGMLIFLVCVAVIAVDAVIAKKFDAIAQMKGHQNYFWWCFLLGLPGWLMVLALPDMRDSKTWDSLPETDSLPDL